IFLKNELGEDFKERPENYRGEPKKDYLFNDRVENLYNYCQNKNLTINSNLEIGDMVFYGNGNNINHISLLIEKPDVVLDAGIESSVIKTDIKNVEKKFGENVYCCRILK
ncbi:MAG: hypothetical protein WC860_09770, partial [Candidatus Margulisiibacteriota bacterium]